MNIRLFTCLCLLVCLSFSCSDDVDAPTVTTETSEFQIELGEKVELTPEYGNLSESIVNWYVDDELVGSDDSYTFEAQKKGVYEVKTVIANESGKESLVYNVRVFGKYADGTLVLCANSEGYDGHVGFLDGLKDGKVVFTDGLGYSFGEFNKVNPGFSLGDNVMSGQLVDGKLYIVSQSGESYITVVDTETLEQKASVLESTAKNPAFITVVNDDLAYVVSAYRKTRYLYPLNLKIMSMGSAIDGLTDVPAIQSGVLAIKNGVLVADGKVLKKVENGTVSDVLTFEENISGIVKDADGNIWLGIEGRTNAPRFVKLNDHFGIAESVELDGGVKLYRNGVLTSANSKYFYWYEPSTGNVHRFSTESKTQELFVKPADSGILMTTALKVHPKSGEVYIAGLSDFFGGEGSRLWILDDKGDEQLLLETVGNTPVDFVFNYKQ
ncbi:hypothetical protein EYV94_03540 [Puteibacter caeruleilacunae]|nr:hypothetical protein EYV94_03540 [Puteibacter caeruleilacunae]